MPRRYLLFLHLLSWSLTGQTIPAGFTDEIVVRVGGPTAIAFTPDGRMLVTTQAGSVRVVQNDQLLPAAALQIPATRICSNSERGLLGVAVDPEFSSNNFIYLYYTYRRPNGDCGSRSANGPVNRVSRFTLPASNVIDPASELVLIDNMISWNGNHNAGDLAFGKDGLLYVSTGDSGCDPAGDSGCAGQNDAARDTHTLLGKVLRITKEGGIPSGNPWQGAGTARCHTGAASPGTRCQETFAWGLRNPFRIAFDPDAPDPRFFILDVGQGVWEEINEARAGADYGWNLREGACANGSGTNCPPAPAGVTDPLYAYRHDTLVPGTQSRNCNSIAGGAFVPRGVWPAEYEGTFLFADFVCGSIFRLSLTGTPAAADFIRGLGTSSAVHLTFGPFRSTQALYYTTYAGGGAVRRVSFTAAANTLSIVSAASFLAGSPLAPDAVASGFGSGLATTIATGAPPLPETLGGLQVRVRDSAGSDRAAGLYLVSPEQINFVVPAGTAAGQATVSVARFGAVGPSGTVEIAPVAPSLFTANSDGRGAPASYGERIRGNARSAVEVFRCGTAPGSCATVPIDLGPEGDQVFLSLFGTGIRGRSGLGAVRATAGGVALETFYAGAQGQFPGLDQVNVRLPRSLAGRGDVDLVLTVDGRVANTVRISIR